MTLIEQHISRWPDWPEDVREKLQQWNKDYLLSFVRGPDFTCMRCQREIKAHPNGNAVLRAAKKARGGVYCEECVIVFARKREVPLRRSGDAEREKRLLVYIAKLEKKAAKMRRQADLERDYVDVLEQEISAKRLSEIKAERSGKYRQSAETKGEI